MPRPAAGTLQPEHREEQPHSQSLDTRAVRVLRGKRTGAHRRRHPTDCLRTPRQCTPLAPQPRPGARTASSTHSLAEKHALGNHAFSTQHTNTSARDAHAPPISRRCSAADPVALQRRIHPPRALLARYNSSLQRSVRQRASAAKRTHTPVISHCRILARHTPRSRLGATPNAHIRAHTTRHAAPHKRLSITRSAHTMIFAFHS